MPKCPFPPTTLARLKLTFHHRQLQLLTTLEVAGSALEGIAGETMGSDVDFVGVRAAEAAEVIARPSLGDLFTS